MPGDSGWTLEALDIETDASHIEFRADPVYEGAGSICRLKSDAGIYIGLLFGSAVRVFGAWFDQLHLILVGAGIRTKLDWGGCTASQV